jgi:hypothetical protein
LESEYLKFKRQWHIECKKVEVTVGRKEDIGDKLSILAARDERYLIDSDRMLGLAGRAEMLGIKTRLCRFTRPPNTIKPRLISSPNPLHQLPATRFRKMLSNVEGFVNTRIVANSLPGHASPQPTREDVARRVRVGPLELKGLRSQTNREAMTPPATANVPHHAQSSPAPRDTFGTEYEGSTGLSMVLAEDSQFQDSHNVSEDSATSEFDGREDFDVEGGFYEANEGHDMTLTNEQLHQQMRQQSNLLDGHSNGYPTTTSGHLDDEDDVDERSGDGSQSFEGEDDGEDDSDQEPTPKKKGQVSSTIPQRSHPRQTTAYSQGGAQVGMQGNLVSMNATPRASNKAIFPGSFQPGFSGTPLQGETSKHYSGGGSRPPQKPQNGSQQAPQMVKLIEQQPSYGHNLTINQPSKPSKSKTHLNKRDRWPLAAPAQQSMNQAVYAPAQNPESPMEESILLDYEPQTLVKMTYNELQQESFDLDPNARPLPFDKQLRGSLDERLLMVRTLNNDDKARFFASIDLAQWEDAGDWFLDQFGEIVNKIRDARRERRKVAASFESEISRRHQNVESRKRNIEQVMVDMKSNGIGVLGRASSNPLKKKREQ